MLMCTFLYAFVFAETFYKILAETLICDPGEKYTCTGYNFGLAVVFSDDKTLCNGNCYKPNNCTNTWSEWSYTSKGVHSFVEKRHRLCKWNNQAETEIRKGGKNDKNSKSMNNTIQRIKRSVMSDIAEKSLPATIENVVDTDLQKLKDTVVTQVGKTVNLSCDNAGLEEIKNEFPKCNHTWVQNNIDVSFTDTTKRYRGMQLSISNVNPYDQGVYTCRINYGSTKRKTIYFTTLVTENVGIPVEVHETKTLKLDCPSSIIGRLFEKSQRFWSLNTKTYISGIPAESRTIEQFGNASKVYEGLWTCTVVDNTTGRKWDVINYQVRVIPLPIPETNSEKWVKQHLVLIGTQSFGVLGCIVAVFLGCCYNPKRKGSEEENEELIKNYGEEENTGNRDSKMEI